MIAARYLITSGPIRNPTNKGHFVNNTRLNRFFEGLGRIDQQRERHSPTHIPNNPLLIHISPGSSVFNQPTYPTGRPRLNSFFVPDGEVLETRKWFKDEWCRYWVDLGQRQLSQEVTRMTDASYEKTSYYCPP